MSDRSGFKLLELHASFRVHGLSLIDILCCIARLNHPFVDLLVGSRLLSFSAVSGNFALHWLFVVDCPV